MCFIKRCVFQRCVFQKVCFSKVCYYQKVYFGTHLSEQRCVFDKRCVHRTHLSITHQLHGVLINTPLWSHSKVCYRSTSFQRCVYEKVCSLTHHGVFWFLLHTMVCFNPRSLLEKIVTRSLEGGGGNRTPLLLSTQFIRLTWNLEHITSFICTFN